MTDNHGTVILHAWVEIAQGCKVKHELVGTSGVSFTITSKTEPFEMYFDTDTLRAFTEHATIALADLDKGHGSSGA